MKEINLNDVVVQGTNKRKVNVSIPNVITTAHQAVNNLNGTLARPVSAKFGTKIRTLKGGDNIPEYINEYYEERPDALYVAKPIYVERRASNGGFGGGSFGDGSLGRSWDDGSIIARQKPERKKRTLVVSNGKKEKKEKQVTNTSIPQESQEPRTIDLDEITVWGGPDPRRVTLPQIEVNTDLPPIEQVDVPTHFTRRMVRQALRNQGINPYDLSGVERRALRHKLNGNYDHNDAVLLNSNPMFTNSYPSEDERLYTRADIRRMAEEAGYDLSARERRALRHYLNNDYSNSDLRHLPAQPFDYDEFVR